MVFVSAKEERGIEKIRELLKGKTTAIAGPSGVGKSSIIKYSEPDAEIETVRSAQRLSVANIRHDIRNYSRSMRILISWIHPDLAHCTSMIMKRRIEIFIPGIPGI